MRSNEQYIRYCILKLFGQPSWKMPFYGLVTKKHICEKRMRKKIYQSEKNAETEENILIKKQIKKHSIFLPSAIFCFKNEVIPKAY